MADIRVNINGSVTVKNVANADEAVKQVEYVLAEPGGGIEQTDLLIQVDAVEVDGQQDLPFPT